MLLVTGVIITCLDDKNLIFEMEACMETDDLSDVKVVDMHNK